MTGFLLLFCATIASIELLRGMRVMRDFGTLARLGRQACVLLARRDVSEWAKERALRLLAARLFHRSVAGFARLLMIASPLLLVLAIDAHGAFGVRQAWTSMPARTFLLVLTTIYWLLRRRKHATPASAEAPGERMLQRIALGTHLVRAVTSEFEAEKYQAAANVRRPEPPVFVTGLARAGTSILVRALHDSGEFAALTYRDLPFPLAPNLWARLARPLKREVATAERAHGDGLSHDLDTPEAIEEVFWRHHERAHYIGPDGLQPVMPRCETIAAFADYARLVQLRYDRPRYLSKNNNNVLRLPALLAAFPDALLVHPFRDPVQQAASLLAQHRSACALAKADPFRTRFMTWLGHHEFGADRRPFLLPGGPTDGDDPDAVDYWLKSWIAVSRSLLNTLPNMAAQQVFVDYDALVSDGGEMARSLSDRLGLKVPLHAGIFRRAAAHHAWPSASLLREAEAVHAELRARAGTASASRRFTQESRLAHAMAG
jgi:hypothetical protein